MPEQMHYVSKHDVINDESITYERWCVHCHTSHKFIMSNEEYTEWKVNKTYIQTVFPHLDSNMREMMISGTCPECFKIIFA
jgi:hypothetical protein